MSIDPPLHLSAEARSHLLDPPPPPPRIDLGDLDAVTEFRQEVHTEWQTLNDQLDQPWTHRTETIAGVPVVRFAPSAEALDHDEVIVHLHGGAYFLGTPMAPATMTVPVAQRAGVPIVSVDYRLAPEHPCPAAVDDAVAVATELGRSHRLIALYGESAGGGLAVATAVALRHAGASMPDRLGLLSPWVDLTLSGDSYRTLVGVDPDFPDPTEPPEWAAAYAGDDPAHPQASPLFANLTGLPPTLIQVGSREILLSDSCRLDAALRRAGVESTLDIWDGLWHVWQLWPRLPEAGQAFDELVAFMKGTEPWS